ACQDLGVEARRLVRFDRRRVFVGRHGFGGGRFGGIAAATAATAATAAALAFRIRAFQIGVRFGVDGGTGDGFEIEIDRGIVSGRALRRIGQAVGVGAVGGGLDGEVFGMRGDHLARLDSRVFRAATATAAAVAAASRFGGGVLPGVGGDRSIGLGRLDLGGRPFAAGRGAALRAFAALAAFVPFRTAGAFASGRIRTALVAAAAGAAGGVAPTTVARLAGRGGRRFGRGRGRCGGRARDPADQALEQAALRRGRRGGGRFGRARRALDVGRRRLGRLDAL